MTVPNLLFLYTDEQAFNTFACYGNTWIEMPNLNALAAQSTVFERAYVTQPVCTPSRSTLLTGLWPHTNECVANNIPLGKGTKCLPEWLPEGVYATGHYGKWHLGDEIFRQHGFDEWCNYEDSYIPFYGEGRDRECRSDYHHYLVEQGFEPDVSQQNLFSRNRAARMPEEHGKPAYVANRSIDFIERHASKPFALYVNFLEPHMPFFGPRDNQYNPEAIPLPPNLWDLPDDSMPKKYVDKSKQNVPEAFPKKPVEPSEAAWRNLRARYYGLCSLVDTHVGRILQTLRDKGLWDNTIIVFTSDHGDMMGAHGQTAKGVMYEEAVRVPMLIKMPGQNAMKRVEGLVSQLDVLPTVLDLMGQKIPEFLQGKSLKPVMESNTPRLEDDVFIEWNAAAPDGTMSKIPGEHADERAVLTADGWKFVWSSCGKHFLFNLNEDPYEKTNLYGRDRQTERVSDYMARIQQWQQKTHDKIGLISEVCACGPRADHASVS